MQVFTVHYSPLSFQWISVRRSHRMAFFLRWICKPTVMCSVDQERRMKERGWKIFLSVKRTSAALGTINHISTALSGDFRRLDAGRIIYITVTSHLFVFWSWPSPHSHLREWRIHLQCGEGSQHSWLLQCIPQAAPLPPALSSGWLPGGVECGTCVVACVAHIWQTCSAISSFFLRVLLRVTHVASLHSGLTLSHSCSWLEAFTGFTGVLEKCTEVIAYKSFPLSF